MDSGRGQRVDIPMLETMSSFVMGDHMGGLTYEPPLDRGGYARHLSLDRRPYKTADGYICVIVYNDKQWENFIKATGRDDMRADPKFATFSGRARRAEFWYFYLFLFVIHAVLSIVAHGALTSPGDMDAYRGVMGLEGLIGLVLLLPMIAVAVRRLHDTDRSGWWWWIQIVPLIGVILLIVFAAERGTPGDNRYGPPPT